MFDANARHIPEGKKFFVECHSLDPDNELFLDSFLEVGGSYLCKKIGDNPYDCKFRIYKDRKELQYLQIVVDFEDEDNFDDYSLFVYSGNTDGTGFINDKWKQKALEFLGGKWDV
ncbi:conserved hypothetical protein [Vibrio phage 277E43-1]|nr:conserved hypothetical protein [Vibrio phage 277E43-1]